MSKIYLIAGEPSGDLHGANLLKALKPKSADTQFRFWGGDRMAAVVGEPVKHIKELAFMGFFEVVANLRTIAKNFKECKKDIDAFAPEVLILIDYPGFNLRMAKWAKKRGIKVVFYISPQVWAWKENRVKKIKAYVDEMLVILPFEKAFYKKHNMDVTYCGHPLLDEIAEYKKTAPSWEDFKLQHGLDDKPIIALLPGSRTQEVKVKLPMMIDACSNIEDYQIIIAGAPTLNKEFYKGVIGKKKAHILYNSTYDILLHANSALVTSGTATLETALFEVPQVVCYKGNPISYHIAKRLIKINYISLVNLIMDEEVVKELIQDECNSKQIFSELEKVLPNGNLREKIALKYKELISKLGNQGASEKAAGEIMKLLS
jgi:lipid-A-disaccharide synthase